MNRLRLQDVQKNLAELIAKLHPGEVVQIMSGDKIVARLMGEEERSRSIRQPGSAIGTLTILDDDDEHLQDFRLHAMRLLLDTHAFLWFVLNDPQLSPEALRLMSDIDNDLLISPASYWEIAIKVSIGKYHIPGSFESWMENQIMINNLEILPIRVAHTAAVSSLPFHHRDPFDRLLVAQALVEKLPLISVDGQLDRYCVERIW